MRDPVHEKKQFRLSLHFQKMSWLFIVSRGRWRVVVAPCSGLLVQLSSDRSCQIDSTLHSFRTSFCCTSRVSVLSVLQSCWAKKGAFTKFKGRRMSYAIRLKTSGPSTSGLHCLVRTKPSQMGTESYCYCAIRKILGKDQRVIGKPVCRSLTHKTENVGFWKNQKITPESLRWTKENIEKQNQTVQIPSHFPWDRHCKQGNVGQGAHGLKCPEAKLGTK